MSNIRTRRAIATLFVLGLLASACGQKDGVHVDLASRAPGNAAVPGAVNPTTGAVDPTATAAPFVDTDGDGLDDATNATQQELALGDPSLASPTDPGAGGDPAAGGGGAGAGGGTDPGATDPGAGGAPAPGSAPGAPAGGNTNAGTPSGPSGGGGAPGAPAPSSGGAQPPAGGGGGGGGGAQPPAGGGGGGGGGAQPPAGGGGGGGGGAQPPGGSQPPPPGPGDSTGVTPTTLKIGIHAPLTGAAPLPASSFQSGKDQYWKTHKVAGRQVEVVFKDDKYNPSSASQVCQELIQRDKVFLLVGSGGTDQIAECARVAAAAGVPYLSAGVTELRLNQLANYFSLSKSYSQQMPLLMQQIKAETPPANKKVGLIASNTANFDDAVQAFTEAAQQTGYTPVIYRPSKQASQGELAGVAQKMAADQVTVATPVMAPTQWIPLARNPQLQNVKWKGVGITQGINTVASAVCPSANGATFFSPWMGLNLSNNVDPNFAKAGGKDDIEWSLWGLNKTLDAAFKKMGTNLTREAFAQAMTGGVSSGIYPNLNHTAQNHFGADSVNVLRLDCGSRQFVSGPNDTFRKRF